MTQITAKQLIDQAAEAGYALQKKKWRIVTAESCTGGGIAQTITAIPGSSSWCDGGFITYSNAMKHKVLGVSHHLLNEYGAVSESVVLAMARGGIDCSDADICVSVSGIAGPGGGSESKPVGTVWMAWGLRNSSFYSQHFCFPGDREQVRQQSIYAALRGIEALCSGEKLCFNSDFNVS